MAFNIIAHAYSSGAEPLATNLTMGETIVYGILFYGFLMLVAWFVMWIKGEL